MGTNSCPDMSRPMSVPFDIVAVRSLSLRLLVRHLLCIHLLFACTTVCKE